MNSKRIFLNATLVACTAFMGSLARAQSDSFPSKGVRLIVPFAAGGPADVVARELAKCRIPDDCIDSKRYPLFIARSVLKELIESLQSPLGVKPC